MKIAFWSERPETGTTFNMSAVACATVMLYPVSVAVVPGDYENQDLENHFVPCGPSGMAAEEDSYFLAAGLDFLLQKSDNTELTEHTLKANMKEVAKKRLYCLPCGKRQYEKWWDKEDLFQKMGQVVRKLENCFEVVFIDCGCRKNDFTRRMLEEADVCVLNMRQDAELIGNYYRSRMRLKGKVFFLVGNYFAESVYNRSNLQRIYRMDEKELGAIPFNRQLSTEAASGKAVRHIESQLQQWQGFEFEQELKRSTRLIMQLAGVGGN